jgi:cation:H+ antiporter
LCVAQHRPSWFQGGNANAVNPFRRRQALVAIFGAYVWRAHNLEKADNPDEEEEPGPAAALNALSPAAQWAAIAGLVLVAGGVILVSAEPFAEAMVSTGRAIGLNEFLLIQWLAPLASEAPAIAVAVLFVRANRASDGLIALISDKINQWTLLVGMLPLALSVGAGALSTLPLDARQGEEFFLTAAQSLLGIALLLRLRLGLWSALALVGLFAVQVGLAFYYRNDEARTIATLTWLAWVYLGLAGLLFLINGRRLFALLRSALNGNTPGLEPPGTRDEPETQRSGRETGSVTG